MSTFTYPKGKSDVLPSSLSIVIKSHRVDVTKGNQNCDIFKIFSDIIKSTVRVHIDVSGVEI